MPLVDQLVAELDANTEGFDAAIARSAKKLDTFGQAGAQAARPLEGHYARATLKIAGTAEAMARLGTVGGQSGKQLIAEASGIAFAFGPTGMIVGAIGVAALAIETLFRRAAEESKQAADQIERNVNRLRNAGDAAGLAARAKEIRATGTAEGRPEEGLDALEARITAKEAEITAAVERGMAAFAGGLRRELAKLKREAAPLQREFQEILDSFTQGKIASQGPTVRPIEIFGASGKQQAADLKQALEESKKAFAAWRKERKEAADASEKLGALERDAWVKLAAVGGDTVDVLDRQIADLITQLVALGATGEQIELITAPLRAAKQAAQALNGAVAEITIPAAVQEQLRAPFAAVQLQLDQLRKDMKGSGVFTDAEIDAALFKKQIELTADELRRLGKSDKEIEQLLGPLSRAKSASIDLADAIVSVGQAVISILGAFGELNQQTQDLARGIVGLGGGVANLLTAKTPGEKLQGGLQIATGIADLVKGAQEGTKEAAQHHKENLARLEAIQKNTGDLVGLAISGAQLATARRGVEAVFSGGPEFDPRTGKLRNVDKLLEQLGFSFDEINDVAKALGITLDGSITSWVDLKAAIDAIDLDAFADTLAGDVSKAAATRKIRGTDTEPQQFLEDIGAFARRSPAVAKALEGIDLTTEAGIRAAKAKLQAMWEDFLAGGLTAEELGVNPEEFADFMVKTVEAIDRLLPKVKTAGEQFNEAMDVWGVAIEFGVTTWKEVAGAAAEKFKALFPELAGSLDFSSLEAFRESAKQAIRAMLADGILTDAERAQIAAINGVIDVWEKADESAAQFAETLRQFQVDLDIIDEAVRFGLLTPLQAVQERIIAGVKAFGAALDGLDFSSAEKFRESAKRWVQRALADNVITEQEQAILDWLNDVLGGFDALEQAANGSADAMHSLAEQMNDFFQWLDDRASILDENKATQLQTMLDQFRGVFGAHGIDLGVNDLFSASGRAELKRRLQDAFRNLAADGIDESEAPLVEAIKRMLALINDLTQQQADAIDELVRKASEALQGLLDELQFEFDLQGITDPLEQLVRTVAKLSTDPRIRNALAGIDLTQKGGRDAAVAALQALGAGTTDKDLRAEILTILHLLRSIPEAGVAAVGGADATGAAGGAGADTFNGAVGITVQQANNLDALARAQLAVQREIASSIKGFLATVPTTAIVAPQVPVFGLSTGANNVTFNTEVTNHFDGAPADVRPVAERISRETLRQIDSGLEGLRREKLLTAGITSRG